MVKMDSICFFAAFCVSSVFFTAEGFYANNTARSNNDSVTFKVTRISQQTTDNGFRVLLQCEAAAKPHVFLHEDSFQSQSETLEMGPDNIVVFSTRSVRVFLVFMLSNGQHLLELRFSQDGPSEIIVPEMEVVVNEGSDVTFQTGQAVEMNVSYEIDGILKNEVYTDLDQTTLVRSKLTENVIVRSHSWLESFEETGTEGSGSIQYSHVRLNTASEDEEGVLGLSGHVLFYCFNSNCLLSGYYITVYVRFYREDHQGPFPESFVGFVIDEDEDEVEDEDDSIQQYCSIRLSHNHESLCSIHCEFVGDRPSPVDIVKVQPNTELELVPSSHFSISHYGFWSMGTLSLDNVTYSDAGDYQCKSRSGPNEVTHIISLTVGHDVEIIGELSTVITFENGSVEATCFAEGTPVPTMTFEDRNHSAFDVSSDAYDVIVTQPETWMTKAVLRIHDAEVAANTAYINCVAHNFIQGLEDGHFSDSYRIHFGPHP